MKIVIVILLLILLYLLINQKLKTARNTTHLPQEATPTSDFYKHILSYQSKPRYPHPHRVVISFGANTADITSNMFHTHLTDILTRPYKVDEVCMNITPDVDKKIIPRYITDCCVIHQTGIDYGVKQALIPTLTRERDQNTLIIIFEGGGETVYRVGDLEV